MKVAMLMASMKTALPRWQQRQFAGVIEDLMEAEELRSLAGAPEGFVMRLAATKWFCSLALPQTVEDLRNGPPLVSRKRSTGDGAGDGRP
jgi:hypothetical protein